MDISILGPLLVRGPEGEAGPDDLGGRKPKQVLEILAAARGRAVTKEVLVDCLWAEQPPRHPIAALENHVWVLRRHLANLVAPDAPPVVVAVAGGYRLEIDEVTLDLDVFDRVVQQAETLGLPQARPQLEAALAMIRGEVLEDEPYADWAAMLRESYRTLVQRVLLDAAEAALLEGRPRAVATRARQALELDPLSERACRLRMQGLAALGERQQALRVFEVLRAHLRADLGLEPLPETLAAYEAVRAGEVDDARPAASPNGEVEAPVPSRPPTTRSMAGR